MCGSPAPVEVERNFVWRLIGKVITQQRQKIFPRKFQVLILVPKLSSEGFLRRHKNNLACSVWLIMELILDVGF